MYAMEIGLTLGGQCQPPCRPIDQPHPRRFSNRVMSLATADGDKLASGCAREAAARRHAFENSHLVWRTGHTGNSFLSDGNSLLIIPAA